MRIALVNYRYFISGGPERYFFNIKEILEGHGHEVFPFSVKNNKNFETPFEKYFLESVGDEEYFAQTSKTPRNIVKSFSRMFYSSEAKHKFRLFLQDVQPDIVYIMQYHNKISPSIISVARQMGIPVVHRISDFQYMCPNALFYNEKTGVCEDCIKGVSFNCIRNKCVMNSALYSAIKLGAKKLHDAMGISRKIDAFVVPSAFTVSKLEKYGIPSVKMHHIPTFFNIKNRDVQPEYQPFFLYVGRIEKQKGLQTLVDAFANTDYSLKIIGFSNNGYIEELKNSLKGKVHNIEFLGKMSFEQIVPYLETCLCTIVPSEWYDNFPNAVLESFAFMKPVIATDFGSLPELVVDGMTGLTFKYKDVSHLRECLTYMLDNLHEVKRMGENAFERIVSEFSPEIHYAKLMEIFNMLILRRNTP